jgi:hypothetical protein
VKIRHHKTGVKGWSPLEDGNGSLTPNLRPIWLASPTSVPTASVALFDGLRQRRVRQARTAAGLPSCITLDACRHGGMTELGDAELTEQGVMSLTRRRKRLASTSSAPSGSVRQCASSSAWVEANGLSTSVGMERQTKSCNERTWGDSSTGPWACRTG